MSDFDQPVHSDAKGWAVNFYKTISNKHKLKKKLCREGRIVARDGVNCSNNVEAVPATPKQI